MTCTECGCNTDNKEFAYCNYPMCNMPVCIDCAPMHALDEAFQKILTTKNPKNKFLDEALNRVRQGKSVILEGSLEK